MSGFRLSIEDVQNTYKRINGHISQTPVLTSSTLNNWSGKELFFKCENLQKTGSFKVRGATNAILRAIEEDPSCPGFVTHSSGNHGQALAYASSQVAGLPCSIVVPNNTPKAKCNAIKGYGAELAFCEPNPTSRQETCTKIANETGKVYIPSSNSYDVMAGQGTIAYEMHEQVADLDAILVTVSGGGLASGVALASKVINPNCKIIAVEAMGKDLEPSLKSGQRLWSNPPQYVDTIAESIRIQQCYEKTFGVMCDLVEKDVITITDEEMVQGMKIMAERMKLVVEAAAGAAVAAALVSDQLDWKFPGLKRIGVVVCGGNLDVTRVPWDMAKTAESSL